MDFNQVSENLNFYNFLYQLASVFPFFAYGMISEKYIARAISYNCIHLAINVT